jgi:glycerol 3-phosphatase-2
VSPFLGKPKTGRVGTSPSASVDVVLADLDGVIYAGPKAIAHAVDSLNGLQAHKRVGYITNNASRTDEQVADHLRSLGLLVQSGDIVTSPQAAVPLLAQLVAPGSTILVVGGDGLTAELEKSGFTVTRTAEDNPAAVIQGFSPDVGWKQLAEAAFALNAKPSADAFGGTIPGEGGGIPWVATNMDWTIPQERGVAPGNGTLVSAVHTAVGRLPVVAGKPELPIFVEAGRRFAVAEQPQRALFIGDRLDTDVMGGVRAGMMTALVLTGIDQAKQLLAAPAGSRPDYILGDLRELTQPYPEIVRHKNGAVSVGQARVRKVGMDLVIEAEKSMGRSGSGSGSGSGGSRSGRASAGSSVDSEEGGVVYNDDLDLLRAACQVIWDSGLAIFGFNVPERLYT